MIYRHIKLIGVDGFEWDLTGPSSPVWADAEQVLWGAPPFEVARRSRAGVPGARKMTKRWAARDIIIPLRFLCQTPTEFDRVTREFVSSTNPMEGDVTIVVTTLGLGPDGSDSARKITATVDSGLEQLGRKWTGAFQGSTSLVLIADDPFWSDLVETEILIEPPESEFDEVLPFYNLPIEYNAAYSYQGISGENAQITLEITNPGDVEAYPVFTAIGPSSYLAASNNTTERSWTLPDGLQSGQELTIDTQIPSPFMTIDGEFSLPSLADGADLWSIPPGVSEISLALLGRGLDTRFKVSFKVRYLTC